MSRRYKRGIPPAEAEQIAPEEEAWLRDKFNTEETLKHTLAEVMADRRSWAESLATIGLTPADRLTWLENFARQDLPDAVSRATAARTLNFFVMEQHALWAADRTGVMLRQQRIGADGMAAIQQAVRTFLDGYGDGTAWQPAPILVGVQCYLSRPDLPVRLVTDGPALSQVLLAVTDVLIAVGSKVRRCETPTCRRLFSANRPGQKRCMTKCGNTERVQAWRKKHEQQLAEKRHQQYARKVTKQKPGAKLKVARRPRKAVRNG